MYSDYLSNPLIIDNEHTESNLKCVLALAAGTKSFLSPTRAVTHPVYHAKLATIAKLQPTVPEASPDVVMCTQLTVHRQHALHVSRCSTVCVHGY
jgi:hypothetical protein